MNLSAAATLSRMHTRTQSQQPTEKALTFKF